MKKTLLSLLTLLAFAPPGVKAQETHTVTWNSSETFSLGYTSVRVGTASFSNSVNTNYGLHNEGGIVGSMSSSSYGYGAFMSIAVSNSTSAITNIVGLQAMKESGADKFQVIFQVTPPNNGVYYHKSSAKEIEIPAGTKVRFRTLGGPIESINIKIYKTGSIGTDASYGGINDVTTMWKCDNADITATPATSWVKITPKDADCTDLTIDLGDKKWCFTNMSGEWTPLANADLPEPKPVSRVWVNGKLYEADESNTITVDVDTVMTFRAELPDGASNIFASGNKLENTKTATIPSWTHTGTCAFSTTSSSKTILVKTGTGSTANSYFTTTIGLLPAYDINACSKVATSTGSAMGYPDPGYTTYVFLRSWNPKSYSSAVTVLKFIRSSTSALKDKTPEIDVDNLPEGCSWDADTKTYSYNKYSTDLTQTGIVRFTNIPFANKIFYTRDRSVNPTTLNNGYDGTATVTPNAVEFPIKLEVEPVNGQRTRFNVIVYDGVNTTTGVSSVFTFYVKYTGGEVAGATPTIQAPLVSPKNGSVYQTLAGGVINFINEDLPLDIESMAGEDKTEVFEYQFAEPVNGVWAQKPEGTWTAWTSDMKVTKTGRLFVREVKDGFESQTTYVDFNKISTTVTDLGLVGITDGQVITLTDQDGFALVAAYNTIKPNSDTGEAAGTKFVYIADNQGRAIKLAIEGNDESDIIKSYLDQEGFGKSALNGITGVIRGVESGLPELWVTTSAMDYAPFLPEAKNLTAFAPVKKEVTEMNRGDFNKNVVMRRLTWRKADNTFLTSTGATVRPYGRLHTEPAFSTIIGTLSDGASYSVEGFVGYAEGEMVLLPTGAVTTPRLLAPNPITATEKDEENGYITVNVISKDIEIRPYTTGVREGTRLAYTINGGEEQTLDIFGADSPAIQISAADFDSDGVCKLSATYTRENIVSEPVVVWFYRHDATEVATIAEFKQHYGDDVTVPDPTGDDAVYYRYTGAAQVRAITPNYLYLRDLPAEGETFEYSDLSAHSILLYNTNGWNAEVAMVEREGGEPRKLEVGDIITNFALIADRTELDNLRGYATGFARTLRRTSGVAAEYAPQEKDILSDNTAFTESDRMVRYTVKNVKVKRTVTDPDETDNDLKRHTYSLEMDGNPVLNIGGVFDIVNGWSTVYDENALYNIEGVVLRNGAAGNYAVALTDFTIANKTALSAPEISIEGADSESEFLTAAKVTMTSAEGADIYFTTDNSDPRNSSTAIKYDAPYEISATTLFKAYAVAKGEIPSAVTEAVFTRRANDRRYIVNFLDQVEEGVPYHFTGAARVVAKGGEYIFVRGTQGHYLPMHIDSETLRGSIDVHDYVSDFVMEAHIINADEQKIVRGAHVTDEYAPLFSAPTDTKPAGLDKDIEFEPDVVTTISAANARRYVKIMGVRLTGSDFESEDGTAALDTEWKLTTEKGAGIDIPVNHTILEPSFDWDATDQTVAAYYNITGFAMIGEDGNVELWPLEVEKVKSSQPVKPSFSGNLTVDPVTADGITTVEFYPSTTVSLSCPIADPESATIYYYVSTDGTKPGSNAKWNVYAQPFAVTSDCYITMYATAEGYEQSAPTYIDMKLGKPAGTVAFEVKAESGKTTVTMTAAEGSEIFWTADATKPMEQWIKYAAPVEFTEAANIQAYAKTGKIAGAVSSMFVMVVDIPETPEVPEDPKDRISGRVKFEIDDTQDGKVIVYITPETEIAGEYEIYYTTSAGVNLTPENGTLYNKETGVVITESKSFTAILVEKGKEAGELCDFNVWVSPAVTGIDGIEGEGDGAVRADGDSIIAPEGSEVFDLNGRRVNPAGLASGVYIVRTPDGKAVKVRI